MTERAQKLGQQESLPVCVHWWKMGEMLYATSMKMTAAIQAVTLLAHLHLKKNELELCSSHSIHVWAAVLLSKAIKDGDYIRVCLFWLSEAYWIYLQNAKDLGHSTTLLWVSIPWSSPHSASLGHHSRQ